MEEPGTPTCGNCSLVCWEKLSDRKLNYEILVNGGEVIADRDRRLHLVNRSKRGSVAPVPSSQEEHHEYTAG